MSSGIVSGVRRTSFLVLASLAPTALGPAQTAPAADVGERVRVFLDTTSIPTSGATIAVPAGDDSQAPLDQAQPGSEVHEVGADLHEIVGRDGPDPFKIESGFSAQVSTIVRDTILPTFVDLRRTEATTQVLYPSGR